MDQEYLKEILDYNVEIGVFTWKVTKGGNAQIGNIAGGKSKEGYIKITINNRLYRAHRLAWLYMTGRWPEEQIDHINHIKDDNRFVNLREATSRENQQNAQIRKDNPSGHKGVTWDKQYQKWRAQISIDKKAKFLGHFDDLKNASANYEKAAKELHGEFYNNTSNNK